MCQFWRMKRAMENGHFLAEDSEMMELSLESAEFSLNQKVNDTSIYVPNVTYRDIGEWTEICTNIPSSLDEITTTCSIERIVGERIETLVRFNASLSKSQE